MDIRFDWNEDYSVGDPEIDEQHKGLFELGNKLPDKQGSKNIKSNIMSLYKYTRDHFAAEEQMMKRIGFPGLQEHKVLHDNLVDQLNEISSQSMDSDEAIFNFKKFVFDWLTSHIMVEDKKYFRFSREK